MLPSPKEPSHLRIALVLAVIWPTALIGLVVGLPLILVTGPIGILLVYMAVITGVRLLEAATSPSEEELRRLVCPWLVSCLAVAGCTALWGTIRIVRGDSGSSELFVAAGFAVAAVGYLALMTFRFPGRREIRDAFRRPKRRAHAQ
ncbi:MAG: hypothetical protein U0Q22_06830 [Acidimicrobiales bacterium]